MHAIVTGGAGFIGTHLCEALAQQGHEVLSIDLAARTSTDGIRHLQADVREEAARRELSKADTIFHLAALRSVQRSVEDPVLSVTWNVECMLAVLQGARPGARIVTASSSSVYGPNSKGLACQESAPLTPCSPYAASKAACEALCESWFRSYGTSIFSLRYFNVYGPGQSSEGAYAAAIPVFLRAALEGGCATIYGGEQRRSFTFIADVVEATLRAAAWENTGTGGFHQIVNVGGARSTSIDELALLVEHASGKPLHVIRKPARSGESIVSHPCLERVQRTLGWAPRVDVAEGLRLALAAMRKGHRQAEGGGQTSSAARGISDYCNIVAGR